MFREYTSRTDSAFELLQKSLLPRVFVQVVCPASELSTLPLGELSLSWHRSTGQASEEVGAAKRGHSVGRCWDRADTRDPCYHPRAGSGAGFSSIFCCPDRKFFPISDFYSIVRPCAINSSYSCETLSGDGEGFSLDDDFPEFLIPPLEFHDQVDQLLFHICVGL